MDLFDSLDKIVPILVFVFWVIISIFTQSQKQKRKQAQRVPGSSGTSNEYRKPEKSSQPAFDDLKKKLETIFSESLPGNQEPELDEEEMRYEDTSTVKQERSDQPKPEVTSSSEEAVAYQPRFEKKKWYGNDANSAYSIEDPSKQTTPTLDLSIDKIREGIILSEILAPPVSLRDNAY